MVAASKGVCVGLDGEGVLAVEPGVLGEVERKVLRMPERESWRIAREMERMQIERPRKVSSSVVR